MAFFLHIETATSVCSVCVSQNEGILAAKTATEPRVHTRQATLMIQSVMSQAKIGFKDLDAIVLSDGPGSYTGLRVGASIAKGICFGLDIPLITINTLSGLANASIKLHPNPHYIYIPMIDARRMEVYLAQYTSDMDCRLENVPYIFEPHSFQKLCKQYKKIVFAGNGAPKFAETVDNEQFVFTDIICDAKNLVQLGVKKFLDQDFADIAYYSPNYIKPPNITKSKKNLFA